VSGIKDLHAIIRRDRVAGIEPNDDWLRTARGQACTDHRAWTRVVLRPQDTPDRDVILVVEEGELERRIRDRHVEAIAQREFQFKLVRAVDLARDRFTMIELVVTVAIVALLATAVIPSAQLTFQREREAELRSSLRILRTAIDAYKKAADDGRVKKDADKSGYPPDLQTLVDGVEDARNPKPGIMIYFLRRIPRDPLWPDATTAAVLGTPALPVH